MRRERKYLAYQKFLYLLLAVSVATLGFFAYYLLDSSIPSVIHVKAGEEQSLDLGVPAKAQIIRVNGQGTSNIPQDEVIIDLNRPVTMKADSASHYRMEVKLFGFVPFKQVGIHVIEDQKVIPVGVPIGIYMKTDGVLVIGVGDFVGEDGVKHTPAKNILHSGDYIHQVNHKPVNKKDEVIRLVEESEGKEVILQIERNEEEMEVKLQPAKDQNGKYKIGTWVRDNAQGVGTMTYMDADGHFGALGHGINDVDTSTLMKMEDGTLYQTKIVSIEKGKIGKPGEMVGVIVYSDDRILGDITVNSESGIFGTCNLKAMDLAVQDPLSVGLKQEIKEGAAQVLCTVNGVTRYYDMEITAIHLDHDNVNRGLEIKITDPELIEQTGGIVQGMSGAPIIQNGKLIGAVTHVLVQDSTRGYGIFAESMLQY